MKKNDDFVVKLAKSMKNKYRLLIKSIPKEIRNNIYLGFTIKENKLEDK